MNRVKISRWCSLFHGSITNFIFPPSFRLEEDGVHLNEIEAFYFPWKRIHDFVPKAEIASVSHNRGLIWDTVVIETRGGNSMGIRGLRKKEAQIIAENIRGIIGR